MKLVTVEKTGILTDSQIIAKAVGMQHAVVMRVIEKFLDDYPDLRVIQDHSKTIAPGEEYIRLEQRVYRGKQFTAAVMNREAFTLVFMRFETDKARRMQREFNKAFYEMERRLNQAAYNPKDPSIMGQRTAAKLARRSETDVIKVFVDYATSQGSKSAAFYYKHITNATYRALELIVQKRPKLRDALDFYELSELILMERLVVVKLQEYMNLGRNYKDIYESVANDLSSYGKLIKLPMQQKELLCV